LLQVMVSALDIRRRSKQFESFIWRRTFESPIKEKTRAWAILNLILFLNWPQRDQCVIWSDMKLDQLEWMGL